ncbi:hypothetical protein P168DRAFT_267264 [Aspergillus campestris IBT 28561]|uniref:Jacalin-type lectin domain-containing protein n=1 Tax=Aspergillus campestris (strain IBT 28561) TaxID=1392248 RepID=A0A2I1D466_ASPC2|nr:uncharacterized protein P168DRAFT_267264 [Aspergillus campestris IBT 28561]PKY04663.1 hypothetical protein P168DRAFT_267264 [Aspergillus campestris IBT 28561]
MRRTALLPLLAPPLLASPTLNVLSQNVAGLPAFLNPNGEGDKTANSHELGRRFAQYNYDVIHVQEDFNYHAAIYESDGDAHPYRTATSGGAGIGSGLNTLARYPWVDFERVKWETCSEASGADCLTPKGYTRMRMRVEEGVYVDFYNLHADAGSEEKDVAARSANLQQVADAIGTDSVGNAVIVFGDTNARYTSSGESVRAFTQEQGMKDPWVDLVLGGEEPVQGTPARKCDSPTKNQTCEVVDKIFYRGSRTINLSATSWRYEDDRYLQDGKLLSDHNPIAANFTWERSESLRQSDLFGGPHGSWFNDLASLPTKATKPARISLRGEERVDSVGVTLSSGERFTHGGSGGKLDELQLEEDEFWTQATLCQGKKNDHNRIFYLRADTTAGRTVSAGEETDDCQSFEAAEGWQIVGFFGQDGEEVDQLGFIYGLQ